MLRRIKLKITKSAPTKKRPLYSFLWYIFTILGGITIHKIDISEETSEFKNTHGICSGQKRKLIFKTQKDS